MIGGLYERRIEKWLFIFLNMFVTYFKRYLTFADKQGHLKLLGF